MFVGRNRPVRWQAQAAAERADPAKQPSPARRQDDLLDEALQETFPASDPVSVIRLT